MALQIKFMLYTCQEHKHAYAHLHARTDIMNPINELKMADHILYCIISNLTLVTYLSF